MSVADIAKVYEFLREFLGRDIANFSENRWNFSNFLQNLLEFSIFLKFGIKNMKILDYLKKKVKNSNFLAKKPLKISISRKIIKFVLKFPRFFLRISNFSGLRKANRSYPSPECILTSISSASYPTKLQLIWMKWKNKVITWS